jgi:signal transduction histidine kinase
VALCAFRIMQESLRNVKKHSGASSAQVGLKLEEATIHLTVCDQGVGFDRKKPMNSEGLGIRSMKERARLLGGRLEFESRVGVGTQIDAWLPMHPKSTVTTA